MKKIFKRGTVVKVQLPSVSFIGIVLTHSQKRGYYIITQNSASHWRQEDQPIIKLFEIEGKKTIHEYNEILNLMIEFVK